MRYKCVWFYTNSPRAATCESRWNIGRRVRSDTGVYENTPSGRVNHEDGAENLVVKSKVLDFAPEKLPICRWNYGISVRWSRVIRSSCGEQRVRSVPSGPRPSSSSSVQAPGPVKLRVRQD